jgi:RHS repeat-associated protein
MSSSAGFAFDIGNRLRQAWGKASYDYDGHGRRAWTSYASGALQLSAYTGTGAAGVLRFSNHSQKGATRYVYLGSTLVAEVNNISGTRWVHTDALGSPVAQTDVARTVTRRTRYEPYGATASGTNPDGIGFTGHVNDVDTGLVQMQQRYYEPLAGRFLSVDPVVTDEDNGALFNRYMYAANNPFTFVDRDGRCTGSLIKDSNGMCASTGGFTTGSKGALQGMQLEREGLGAIDLAEMGSPESNRQGLSDTAGDQAFVEGFKALMSVGVEVAAMTPAGRGVKLGLAANSLAKSWSSARAAYWKMHGPAGQAPQRTVLVRDLRTGQVYRRIEMKELHHVQSRSSGGGHRFSNLKEVWPTEHSAIDSHRRTGYEVVKVISEQRR